MCVCAWLYFSCLNISIAFFDKLCHEQPPLPLSHLLSLAFVHPTYSRGDILRFTCKSFYDFICWWLRCWWGIQVMPPAQPFPGKPIEEPGRAAPRMGAGSPRAVRALRAHQASAGPTFGLNPSDVEVTPFGLNRARSALSVCLFLPFLCVSTFISSTWL